MGKTRVEKSIEANPDLIENPTPTGEPYQPSRHHCYTLLLFRRQHIALSPLTYDTRYSIWQPRVLQNKFLLYFYPRP